jgi:hypothetical protein
MKRLPSGVAASIVVLLGTLSTRALADDTATVAEGEEELLRESENPVSRLISLPFQSNLNFGVGPGRDLQYVLNIQPIIPTYLGAGWNLIHRPIIPIIAQPEPVAGQGGAFGLGDVQYQLYLSPDTKRGFIWGLGPVVSFATATDTLLGSGRSSIGPTGVALFVGGPWVVGVLMNQLWSFSANPDAPSVSQMTIQPLINFNFPNDWYLAATPVMTSNWKADGGEKWTIPVGGGGGKIVKLGGQPINLQLQAFWFAAHPDNGPRWSLRPIIVFLFPR